MKTGQERAHSQDYSGPVLELITELLCNPAGTDEKEKPEELTEEPTGKASPYSGRSIECPYLAFPAALCRWSAHQRCVRPGTISYAVLLGRDIQEPKQPCKSLRKMHKL